MTPRTRLATLGKMKRIRRRPSRRSEPGSRPGLEAFGAEVSSEAPKARFRVVDYGPAFFEVRDLDVLTPQSLQRASMPEGARVRWVQVIGADPASVALLSEAFEFHTLSAEDVLETNHRPKVDAFADHLFVIMRAAARQEGGVSTSQVSMFLYADTLITVQEEEIAGMDRILARLENRQSRMRSSDASYLFYAVCDLIGDAFFPVLESCRDQLEALDDLLLSGKTPRSALERMHLLKRDLERLRRIAWPQRDLVQALIRHESPLLSETTRVYLRDVADHHSQVVDLVDRLREEVAGLNGLYQNIVSNRANEVMKVLTVMASVFIPITFLAGVYGMNFKYIPEFEWRYSYPVFWGVCALAVAGLLVFFRRKGWLGNGDKDAE